MINPGILAQWYMSVPVVRGFMLLHACKCYIPPPYITTMPQSNVKGTLLPVCMCARVCVCMCVGLCVHLRALKAVWHSDETSTSNLADGCGPGRRRQQSSPTNMIETGPRTYKQANLRLGVEGHKERYKRTHTSSQSASSRSVQDASENGPDLLFKIIVR